MLKRLCAISVAVAVMSACDWESGPVTEISTAQGAVEQGVITHRVRNIATETATSATDKPVEGRVLDLESSREVSVPINYLFKVELPANAGTGYVWNCTLPGDAPLKVIGQPSTRPIDRGVMGGRMIWTFTLEPTSIGVCQVQFALAHPWESGVAPVKTASLTVHVVPAVVEKE